MKSSIMKALVLKRSIRVF